MLPKTRPCTTFRVWSTVGSMAILSHNSAASMRGQPSAGSRSRESTVMPVAVQTGLPGLQNSILPGFHPHPATRARSSDWWRELVSCSTIQKTFRRLVLLWPRLRSLRIGWLGVTSRPYASAGTSQSGAWRILQTGEAAAAAAEAEAETQEIGEKPEEVEVTPSASWNGAARGS